MIKFIRADSAKFKRASLYIYRNDTLLRNNNHYTHKYTYRVSAIAMKLTDTYERHD